MTKDELALFLFEQCQNRTASAAAIVQAVADKAGVSPEAIDSVVRGYRNTGTGLEEAASKILGNTDASQIVIPDNKIVTPAEAIVAPAGFAIHNGVVVTLEQKKSELNVIDSTIPELKGLPLSQDYFDSRAKQLFGDVTYDLKNLAERINKDNKTFDLALVEVHKQGEGYSARNTYLYEGVKYSGWKMQTEAEIEAERVEQERQREQAKIDKENRLAEQDRLMESLGFDKFDEPEKCYQVYCMLKANDEDFVFDINLLSEEGCGNIFYYDNEEYKVVSDDELTDEYYEQEAEYIRDNPHDYVYDACTSEMIERLYDYNAETFESDNGHYHVIKE